MSFVLLQQIAVLFLIMAMGSCLIFFHLLKVEDSKIISVICIYVIIPCVILKAYQIEYTPQIRDGFILSFMVSFAFHFLMFALLGILKKPLHLNELERVALVYPNAGNLILPLVIALFGEEWVIYTSAFICAQNIFLWTHGNSVMQGSTSLNWKKIITNPNIICIAIGLTMFLSGVRFPEVINSAVSGVTAMTGPASMLMTGMVMAGVPWKKILSNNRIYLMLFLRMILFPLVMTLFAKYCASVSNVQDGQNIIMICLLAAIAPTAATVNQLAILHDRQPEYASAINTLSTLLCIVTMPIMIGIYLY